MANADQRRAPRLAARCRVEIDDRFGAWTAETEDLGIRGCRLVTCRAPRLGALIQLTFTSDRHASPLRMAGQAVWARDGKVGVSFVGPLAGTIAPAAWIRDLAAALEDGPRAEATPARAPPPPPAPPPEVRPRAIALGPGRERPAPTPPPRALGGAPR